GLTERREPELCPVSPESRSASPVRTVRAGRVSRLHPPPVLGTHSMTLRPSTAPQRVPLPSPPASSLAAGPDPASDSLRAASPAVTRFLATAITDPLFESTAMSALVTGLVEFAAACRLDYATSLVAESASASVYPPSVGAMDAEMASWKSTGTYVDEVPPPGANIGVDFFQTFSPTPKMTTLRVLLHVAAQRDYELHSLDFSTAFLQGSLREEIWLRRPPGFTGSFPAGTQWSLRRPVYGLRQAPREWHDTLRSTLAILGFAPSTSDPSLFLCTDTTLPPFYVLVYVDDLVFATCDTEALAHVKSELQKRHTCTDLGELKSYLGLRITRDRAQRTITLTQSHKVQHVLQRFGFTYSSPQSTPLPTGHSLSAPPSDESVEPSGPYPELVGCLITSGMGLVLGGQARVVLTGHADASWGFADGTVPTPPVDDVELHGEFRAALLLTFMVISRGCSPVVQLALRSCRERLDAGHEAWHFILSTYQVKDNLYIGQLAEKMTHIRMGEQESAIDYCNRARRILVEMRMAGVEYSTSSYITHVLKGLPRSYNLMKRMTMVPGTRGGRRRECWICHDPDHLSYECPDRDDNDEDDTKGGRGRSTSRRPRRDAKPRKEKQKSKKTSSTKDVDNSSSKSQGDGEASCSMVGVVEPTVSLAPEVGEDFQVVAAAVQANLMVVLLDSDCSHHLMGTKAVFVNMAPIDDVKHVRRFNEALQPVEDRGTVALQGEAGKRVLILISGVQANLLSAGQLKESGVQLQGDGDEMLLVAATGEVLGRARYNGRVLCTNLRPCSTRLSLTKVVALQMIVSAPRPPRPHAPWSLGPSAPATAATAATATTATATAATPTAIAATAATATAATATATTVAPLAPPAALHTA
ncbi:unnamed protein product, partial [Closterium sp. NIES-54]